MRPRWRASGREAIDPHRSRPQRSGGRRDETFLSREEWAQHRGRKSQWRRCGQAIGAQPAPPGPIRPSRGRMGQPRTKPARRQWRDRADPGGMTAPWQTEPRGNTGRAIPPGGLQRQGAARSAPAVIASARSLDHKARTGQERMSRGDSTTPISRVHASLVEAETGRRRATGPGDDERVHATGRRSASRRRARATIIASRIENRGARRARGRSCRNSGRRPPPATARSLREAWRPMIAMAAGAEP
jgi:hypothetical protein